MENSKVNNYMNKKLMKIVDEYQKNLKKCKEYRKKYLLINNRKEIVESYSTKMMPNFNSYKIPYIDEKLKFRKLITDLDVVNQNIIESRQIWEKITANETDEYFLVYNTYLSKRLDKLHEYIAFDLKHFIDEIIATVSVIKGAVINNRICISSVGDYLNTKNDKFHDFDDFYDLFDKINTLANSYKHSYADSNLLGYGRDEDCFITLYSKYNNFSSQPVTYVVSVNYVVEEFNKFYKFAFELIDNLTKDNLKSQNI